MRKRLGKFVSSVITITVLAGLLIIANSNTKLTDTQMDVEVVGLEPHEKQNLNNFMNSVKNQIMANNYLTIEYMQERGGVYDNRETSTSLAYSMDMANEFQCEVVEEGYTANIYFQFGDKVIDSIIMPGMDGTIVEEQWCDFMVPQGITYQDGYFFITAYCSKDNHRSVIYVIDAETKSYVTTLVRGEVSHSGGITIAGGYMWLCDGYNHLKYYDYNQIRNIIRDDLQSIDLSRITQGIVEIDNKASYCTTYNDLLCVGSFDDKVNNNIYIYEPEVNVEKLIKRGEISDLPVNTQGVLFYTIDEKEYMLLTSSLGRWNSEKYYSRIYMYEFDSELMDGGQMNLLKTYILPPMVEELTIYNNTVYLVFESCASEYRKWGASPVISKVCGFDGNFIFK